MRLRAKFRAVATRPTRSGLSSSFPHGSACISLPLGIRAFARLGRADNDKNVTRCDLGIGAAALPAVSEIAPDIEEMQ